MSNRSAAVTVGCLLVSAGSALAFIPWSNSSGSGSFFDWTNGGSDNGLFGDPTLVGGDTFAFFPSNFRAESVDGVSDNVNDRVQFELIAHAGFTFDMIEINEVGDYGIAGTGEVSATGSLFVTDLDLFRVLDDELETTPGSPITSGAGTWTGQSAVDLTMDPPDFTHIMVVFDNNLLAISMPGSTTFIEKKVVGGAVFVSIVPSPSTLGLFGLGGLALIRRRR
jgi:hypothetical protein